MTKAKLKKLKKGDEVTMYVPEIGNRKVRVSRPYRAGTGRNAGKGWIGVYVITNKEFANIEV